LKNENIARARENAISENLLAFVTSHQKALRNR
jgi:hypothetical protein